MKKILILLSIITLLVSCKQNIVNSFDAVTVKKELVKALDGSVWDANNQVDAYYTKIAFTGSVITVTLQNGTTQILGYQVTNVTAPEADRPNKLQLRLKSGLQLDEMYLSQDYKELESVVYDRGIDPEKSIDMYYTRVK